jgi:hypothetical protein
MSILKKMQYYDVLQVFVTGNMLSVRVFKFVLPVIMTLSKLQYFDDNAFYFFQNYGRGNVLPDESLFHELLVSSCPPPACNKPEASS